MLSYGLHRLLMGIAVLVAVSLIAFALTNIATDPARAIAGPGATEADVATVRNAYGFDRPLAVRYVEWLADSVKGNLGESYRQKRPVLQVIVERLPVTVALGCAALLFATCLSIPLGILGALRPNSWVDHLAMTLALLGQAMPTFWFALLGIVVFSVSLQWLPASGSNHWTCFILPAIALGYYAAPTMMRLTRAGMIEVLEADYIRTARAKGLRSGSVIFKHALRNAILPVVSVAAVQFGFMLGGSVVIETIFAMEGVGYLAWESITQADLPIVQALVVMTACFYIVLTLAADLLNAWLNPRIRVG